jgi:hypothetical protein
MYVLFRREPDDRAKPSARHSGNFDRTTAHVQRTSGCEMLSMNIHGFVVARTGPSKADQIERNQGHDPHRGSTEADQLIALPGDSRRVVFRPALSRLA